MALKLIIAPAVEPVTLAQAKAHLRVTTDEDDALIVRLIIAARMRAEATTWRRLCTQTVDYVRDRAPCGVLELPCPPVQSITDVKYIDDAGVERTLSALLYQVDVISEPARIKPAYGESWPSVREQLNAFTVRMVCGYGGSAQVPSDIQSALLLMIGHYYEHREEVSDFQKFPLPSAVDALLDYHMALRF